MVKPHGFFKKGKEYNIKGKLADSLLKKGEAVEVKEEKVNLETKEEKFAPEVTKSDYPHISSAAVKDFSTIYIKDLEIAVMTATDDQLLKIVKRDKRKSAVRIAEDEIRRRGV